MGIKIFVGPDFGQAQRVPLGHPNCVTEKDGLMQMYADHRELKKLTVINRYPLPHIHELFDELQDATVFPSLDLA